MIIPTLCLICFIFLCWILILKGEINHMKKERDRLKTILQTKLGDLKDQVKIEKGRPLVGREVSGSMLTPPDQ